MLAWSWADRPVCTQQYPRQTTPLQQLTVTSPAFTLLTNYWTYTGTHVTRVCVNKLPQGHTQWSWFELIIQHWHWSLSQQAPVQTASARVTCRKWLDVKNTCNYQKVDQTARWWDLFIVPLNCCYLCLGKLLDSPWPPADTRSSRVSADELTNLQASLHKWQRNGWGNLTCEQWSGWEMPTSASDLLDRPALKWHTKILVCMVISRHQLQSN